MKRIVILNDRTVALFVTEFEKAARSQREEIKQASSATTAESSGPGIPGEIIL